MRLLLWLLEPFRFLLRLLTRPLLVRARKRALKKFGWIELHVEGDIREVRHPSRLPPIVKRWLKREDPPQVVLTRLRRFAAEVERDADVKGVLVRLGLVHGGWASAAAVRAELERVRAAGKTVFVHLAAHAGNREFLIASAASHLSMTPTAAIAAVGTSSMGLFLKNTLDRAGVKVEVAAKGRYKSATEQLTRVERSQYDLEQTKAVIDAYDAELERAIATGRQVDDHSARAMIDRAPIIGLHAKEEGWCDELAREEELPERVQALAEIEEAPTFVGAGRYLALNERLQKRRRRAKVVGVVEVHGAIVEQGGTFSTYFDRMAVQKTVVNDLRAALEDDSVGAVVLHVDSRGGSVTASDAIYSAVARLDREKPVIACFGDVSASGGYYVACGARAIVCSPLTITGSIGVFAMYPTWPELGQRFGVGHDVVQNHKHAALHDPWREMPADARAHAEREVDAMYMTFLDLVAGARKKTREEIHAVAEGRVWTGRDAHGVGLIDGLGGMVEAVERAKAESTERFQEEAVYVHGRGTFDRPDAPKAKDVKPASLLELAAAHTLEGTIARELLALAFSSRRPLPLMAYAPVGIE